MIRYWKAISMVLIGAIFPFIHIIPGVAAGFLSAVALFFAVEQFIIEKWGHLTVKQFTSRKVWMSIGIVGLIVGTVSILRAFNNLAHLTYLTALILWFFAFFGLFLGLCGAGVAMMRNE